MKNQLRRLPVYIVVLPLIVFVTCLYGGVFQRFVPALAVGNGNYTAAEFNYWFYERYLSFVDEHYDELDSLGLSTKSALDRQQYADGETWEDYFRLDAEEELRRTDALLSLAGEYGVGLDADSLPGYAELMARTEAERQESGQTLEDYIHSYYGASVSVDIFEQQALRLTGAQAVEEAIKATLEPADSEISAYAAAHPETGDYLTADLLEVCCAPAKDRQTGQTGETQLADMKARLEQLQARWKEFGGDEAAFSRLAVSYSDGETAADGGLLKNLRKGTLPDALDRWTFDEPRNPGDVTSLVTEDGVWLVYYRSAGASVAWEDARQALIDEQYEALISEAVKDVSVRERFGMRIAM